MFAWKVAAFAAFAAAGKLREGARENRVRVELGGGTRMGGEGESWKVALDWSSLSLITKKRRLAPS